MTVGIIGLGLIGGSLAKAFRRDPSVTVLGWDRDPSITEFAQIAQAIQGPLTDERLGELDLLLLATYPEAVVEHMERLAPLLQSHTMVIDCAGTKEKVCQAVFPLAQRYGFPFLGGHPMAGTHFSGFKYSRADLFDGAPMVLVPPTFDDIRLLDRAKKLLAPVGFGRVSITTADKHDQRIAFTSQMAHVISNAYIKSPTAREHDGFSAGSYKDLTRVAWLNPSMWAELFLENKKNLLFELDTLIGNLNQYKQALEDEDFPTLCRLLDEAVELIRLSVEKKGQIVSVHTGEGLHQLVLGDERRLKQVLVNILENASKYTGEGGRISLSVDELDKGESTVGTYRFVVEDNGIGMSPEYIEHIFEPFSRADDSRTNKIMGTGLGMTIVKNIVSIMGGDVRAESEYGKGSRFIVTLCLAKSAAAGEVTAEGAHTDESFSDLRVLLVEDNELNREIAAEMLALLGARVESVENGRLAVEAVCSHPPYYYDIVFMDIQMPVLNGYDAAKEIRGCGMKSIGDLPIIAMTADAFAEDAKLARLAGMNGHLAKPISIEQLKGALSGCVAWKRRSRGGDILNIGD